MFIIALKMLIGDRTKYYGLIFGVAFATLLMAQQISIFLGLITRVANPIYAIPEVDLWVMDPRVRYLEEVEPMRDIELSRVKGIEGVEWAVPFYKGQAVIRRADGDTQQVQLIGVDDISLIGLPRRAVLGDLTSIKRPQTALIEKKGYMFMWPDQSFEINKTLELNDNRLVIRGICQGLPTFLTFPTLYVSYSTAVSLTPPTRKKLPFILVKAQKNENLKILKERIQKITHLQVLTSSEFAWRSISYILERTAIPINFGITILLGIIIGGAITAQTFYLFIIEHIKQFGAMKAIGFSNGQLFKLVMIQALFVCISGFGLGIGATALFFSLMSGKPSFEGFLLKWYVIAGTFGLIISIILLSISFSLYRVFKLDPATIFRSML